MSDGRKRKHCVLACTSSVKVEFFADCTQKDWLQSILGKVGNNCSYKSLHRGSGCKRHIKVKVALVVLNNSHHNCIMRDRHAATLPIMRIRTMMMVIVSNHQPTRASLDSFGQTLQFNISVLRMEDNELWVTDTGYWIKSHRWLTGGGSRLQKYSTK